MKHLFFGGIHPKYNKEMSKTTPDVKVIDPETVVIPMLQHIGAPCQPLVQVGDRVFPGIGPKQIDWFRFVPGVVEGLSQVAYTRPTWWAGSICHVEAGRK